VSDQRPTLRPIEFWKAQGEVATDPPAAIVKAIANEGSRLMEVDGAPVGEQVFSAVASRDQGGEACLEESKAFL
jgi:hypothetical protein